MIGKRILELVDYGLKNGLLEKEDRIYTVNRLLELFGLDEPEEGDISPIKAGEGDTFFEEEAELESLLQEFIL